MIPQRVQWICCLLLGALHCIDVHLFEWDKAIRNIRRRPRTRNLFKFLAPVVPGTKWCGPGDVAADNNDLGIHARTDSCCRVHDKCPDIIEAGQSKHGLTNHAPYVRLNCDCDDQFLKCLRNSTDDRKWSQALGTLYFGILRQKCFKLEHKIIKCKKNSVAMRCEKYTLDRHSRKSWQWFDVPNFWGGETIKTATSP